MRAARVRLALARSVRYEAGPLVALLALPSDALVGAGDHVGRLQVAVALLVPLPRDLGMRRPQVVIAFRHLAVAAVGATAVGTAGPVVGGYPPCVPTPASPPDPPRAAGDDAVGSQVAVALEIPFSHELGMRGGQVVEAAQQLAVLAVRAAVVDAHGAHAHLLAPDVAARSAPPYSGRIAARDVERLEGPVSLLVPLRQQIVGGNLKMNILGCGQIVGPNRFG